MIDFSKPFATFQFTTLSEAYVMSKRLHNSGHLNRVGAFPLTGQEVTVEVFSQEAADLVLEHLASKED